MDLDFLGVIWMALRILDITLTNVWVFQIVRNLTLVTEYSRRHLVDVRTEGQALGGGGIRVNLVADEDGREKKQ